MAKRKASILNDLSTTDLKRLLAARERIDVLEKEKARLMKDLAAVEKELGQLMEGGSAKKTVRRKKAAKKKVVRRKATKKKTAKKKTVKKAAAKKKPGRKAAAGKTAVKKKAARRAGKPGRKKTAPRRTAKKASGADRVTLEDVIVQVIRKNKGPIGFQDLMKSIVKGKLFKTKSRNFDNVLRRTLSTSKAVKRVGRGIYDAA